MSDDVIALDPVTVTAPRVQTRVAPARRAAPPVVITRDEAVPVNTPNDALQQAAPSNSPLQSAYVFAAKVLVNGIDLGPPIQFQVSANSYYQADRYYTELALAALSTQYQEAFWSDGDQKKMELRCGIKGSTLKSLIVGLIDDCEIDWQKRIVKLRGRDLTSLLIDNKTAEKFPNKTASQVAEEIATRRGLSAKITATTTIVGTYFQREHAKLTTDVTEHDLLTFLAEQEGFNYWVEGTTLHFEQPPAENTKPFVITYKPPTSASIANGTFIELTTRRNETLAKDLVVKVVSFDAKKKHVITAQAKRSRVRSSSRVTSQTTGAGSAQQAYVYRIPGLSQEQAQAKANQLATEISKHERSIRVEVPFDPAMDARTRISLRGTQTAFDQPYFVDSIEYAGSFQNGSRMEITAKNTSPQSQVSLV